MWRVAGSVLVTALVLPACASSEPEEGDPRTDRPPTGAESPHDGVPEKGYRMLFDGTQESMDEWRMAGPGEFVVAEGGSMRTVGGMGLLWYPELFGSYSLKLDWKMAGDDNSGVFVGFPDPGDDPWVAVEHGYEVQIDASDEPDRTTGAIYAVQGADTEARDAVLNPPGMWNSYEIVVDGDVVDVYLNGVLINHLESADPARDLSEGFVGLQNHSDADEVYFRNIRIATTPAP